MTDLDWRSKLTCDSQIADRAYDTAEDLVEDQGLSRDDAIAVATEAVAAAKRVCAACPVKAKCRDAALRAEGGEIGFGVWGAMDPAERLAYRPTWLKIKKLQGVATAPAAPVRPGALHVNAGANARLQRRRERALIAKDRLTPQSGFVLDTGARNYGKHDYSELMHILNMVLDNPTTPAEDLAKRIGRSGTWINGMLRFLYEAMGVPGCGKSFR